jgi:DNA-binding transcriptional LysR family regulator
VSQKKPLEQLPYLDTFAKAAELGSFTAAGQALGMTQAAVSQRIQALEAVLRVSMFDRKAGRISLTDAGRRLYAYAEQILALHRDAFDEIARKKTPISGELVLAASSIPGEHLLPGILSLFRTQYPEGRVRAAVLDSSAVIEQVEQNRAHLGLVGRTDESLHLQFRPFARDELVVVIPPNHRWKKQKQISLKQLAGEPLIIREPGSGTRWRLEQALAANNRRLSDLPVALELGSNESIKESVLQGMGVAVLSALAVQKELTSGRLRALKVRNLPLDRLLFVVWDKRRVLPSPARVFLHFLERLAVANPDS